MEPCFRERTPDVQRHYHLCVLFHPAFRDYDHQAGPNGLIHGHRPACGVLTLEIGIMPNLFVAFTALILALLFGLLDFLIQTG